MAGPVNNRSMHRNHKAVHLYSACWLTDGMRLPIVNITTSKPQWQNPPHRLWCIECTERTPLQTSGWNKILFSGYMFFQCKTFDGTYCIQRFYELTTHPALSSISRRCHFLLNYHWHNTSVRTLQLCTWPAMPVSLVHKHRSKKRKEYNKYINHQMSEPHHR